jgi:hypothetical protein
MGNDAAAFINKQSLPKEKMMVFGPDAGRSLYFYGRHIFPNTHDWRLLQPEQYIITVMDSVPVLQQHYPGSQIVHKGFNYGVSMLTPEFLNPATRDSVCGKYAIVQLPPRSKL